ncbi:MAG: hypothetical protein DDG60_10895 [Anaerolineae bacterium]|nr:MAG: hypothetical protein DDG60_10895 [Anaerolineae bacterium]
MDATSLSQTYQLLALCARVERHASFDEQLTALLRDFSAWDTLPAQAERHGLGPLLWYHLREAPIPVHTRRALQGLYLRERALTQIHTQTLLDTLEILDRRNMRPFVLKGLALAWQVYPDPALRPVSDLDLFLPKEHILPAMTALQAAGYQFQSFSSGAVHLPKGISGQAPLRQGVSVQIELHHYDPTHRVLNDYSPDDEFRDFTEPPLRLTIAGGYVYTTAPLDTLHYLMRHFVRHLFDSRLNRPISFKWMADMIGCVEKWAPALDWKTLLQRDPLFLKRLSVLYSLGPAPDGLATLLSLKSPAPMGRLGQYPQGWPQWPFPNWRQVGFWRYVGMTFAPPPEWWLRLYYGLDEGSVFWHAHVGYRLRLVHLMSWALFRRLFSLSHILFPDFSASS